MTHDLFIVVAFIIVVVVVNTHCYFFFYEQNLAADTKINGGLEELALIVLLHSKAVYGALIIINREVMQF